MELLTVKEVAKILRMTPRNLYTLVSKKGIPFKQPSCKILFDKAELQEWINRPKTETKTAA